MKTLTDEELLIRLIKDSLINAKLISGLNSLGLNADDYSLSLGDTIFKLMGFESGKSDFIFEKVFIASTDRIMQIEFSRDELTLLSMEIYQDLLLAKEMFNYKE